MIIPRSDKACEEQKKKVKGIILFYDFLWCDYLCSPHQPDTRCRINNERKCIMKEPVKLGWIAASLCAGLLVVGCSSTYYKVTDPHSGTAYYTQKVDTLVGTGAVKVKDARSGSVVTLQSSEVKEISEKEYKAGIAAPVTPPTPAPAAAPAAAPEKAPEPTPAATPAPAAEPASNVAAPATSPSDVPAPAPAAVPTPAPTGTN
jgi:hypothetical protein